MKKSFFYASLLCVGVASCSKDYYVPEDEMPEWLGESIYAELSNPSMLDGTFTTYLRLVDDLGYADVLSRTGSKTIFPANDEAFEEFFKDGNNRFGASSYEDLTETQKAQLLYCSMLDNAIVVGELSNDDSRTQGMYIKHPTNISLVQSVQPLYSQNMPANNSYFDYWRNQGRSINALYDDTRAPMVHFTGEYMLSHGMTIAGDESDFYVLTGTDYEDGDVFVFDDKVINSNVTCQNGYIHQLENVLVNPGNMAEMLRENENTQHFSRMLDYYCAPFQVTGSIQTDYWASMSESGTQDSVYAIRYFSKNSQGATLASHDSGGRLWNDEELLSFDPGWNYYNASTSGSTSAQEQIAAIFVPTDDVLEDYFTSDGAYIVENLGEIGLENTAENLDQHLDAIFNTDKTVLASFINNLMQAYLSNSVPSKFSTVQNDAFEFMDVTKDDIAKNSDGTYNVSIANNGVLYMMNKLFAPEKYNSVLGPSTVFTDMHIMGELLSDHQTTAGTASVLGCDMYYYLLSMQSKYAVFCPKDGDEFFYIDPASRYDSDQRLKALRFYYDSSYSGTYAFNTMVQRYYYDKETGDLTPIEGEEALNVGTGYFNTQLKDMLDYHTVVLSGTSGLTGNHYYKTKSGGAIYVPDGTADNDGTSTVLGGAQIDNTFNYESVVEERFYENGERANITNGTVYKLTHPIQPTLNNVYDVLSETDEFSEFFEFCNGFGNEELLTYAGILTGSDSDTKLKRYQFFGENDNVSVLSAYNYTLYVPLDMDVAYENGLPKWEDLEAILEDWEAVADKYGFQTEEDATTYLSEKIEVMREFMLYHFHTTSVFADESSESSTYQTLHTNDLGIAERVTVNSGNNELTVTDATGEAHAAVNKNILARDVAPSTNSYGFSTIESSAFVTIHSIEKPLCYNSTFGY